MKMLDKDFDQLFNAKLGDLEVEPSAELWGKIAPQIPGSDAKRTGLMPFMRIAATLIVVLGAGLLFMPKQEKIPLRGTHDPAEAATSTAAVNTTAQTTTDPYSGVETSVKPETVKPMVAYVVKPKPQATINVQVNPAIDNPADTTNTVARVALQEPIKVVYTESIKSNLNTALANNIIKEPTPNKVLAVNNPEPKVAAPVKKAKVRGISGFLNAMIAKVDKRDDKIIQFGNDDDDGDIINVTSVNLGPIKVKKQE